MPSSRIVNSLSSRTFHKSSKTFISSSCFPQTIIVRVLECGLRDYCTHMKGGERGKEAGQVPKMASVVGILGHLAGQHGRIIRAALVDMFQVSSMIKKPKQNNNL